MDAPDVSQEEHGYTHQPSGQRNPVTTSGSENLEPSLVSEGSSIAAISRSLFEAVSDPFGGVPSYQSSSHLGLYPALGRLQHVVSGHPRDWLGSEASGEHQASIQTELLIEGGHTTEGNLTNMIVKHSNESCFRTNICSSNEFLWFICITHYIICWVFCLVVVATAAALTKLLEGGYFADICCFTTTVIKGIFFEGVFVYRQH